MNRKLYLAIGAVAVVIAAWLLWPSRYAKVANRDSHGTNIIAFGDSLTAGYGAPPGEDYPSVATKLSGLTIINAGVAGDTTESALARIDDDVLARDPRVVIVGLGGNDFLHGVGIDVTERNLREIVRRSEGAGAMVVLLGFHFPSLSANYGKMYERIARDERCLLIDDVLDGIESNPQLKADEIHPNGRGYEIMAKRVASPLKKLLRS